MSAAEQIALKLVFDLLNDDVWRSMVSYMWFVIGVIAVSSLMLIVRLFAVLNVGGKTGLNLNSAGFW